MERMRLQKFFSECGVMSRRAAEAAITQGRVTVNDRTAELGESVDPERDTVCLDGKPISRRSTEYSYYMLHKPRGYITTLSDEKGRKCVTELLSHIEERVYPVGRLDYNSEGLLIFTNDGTLANRLMHPGHGVKKTYIVVSDSAIDDITAMELAKPVDCDGETLKADSVELISPGDKHSVLKIVLSEGKNREIRRIFEANGLSVRRLKRISMGKIELGELKKGEVRPLTAKEVNYLKSIK